MPSNEEYRSLAQTDFHAVDVVPFRQSKEHCAAWVTLWLRRSLKKQKPSLLETAKPAWFLVKQPSSGAQEKQRRPTDQTLIDKVERRYAVFTDPSDGQEGKHHEHLYLKDRRLPNRGPTDPGRPAKDALRLEMLRGFDAKLAGDPRLHAPPAVARPSPPASPVGARAAAPAAPIAAAAARVHPAPAEVIDDLVPVFAEADAYTALIRMSVEVPRGATNNHAIGIDCWSQHPKVRYFDPLLGEFTFPAMKDLLHWWAACFAMRDTSPVLPSYPGAFDHYGPRCWGKLYTVATAVP